MTRRRVVAHRRRMAGLEIPPARAQQIQQALIQDGDYRGLPTGRWDSQTRAAMRLYQHKNGFQATGLPDAKSLMKMGLGPHPLPPQLDPLAQAGAGASIPGAARGQAAIPPQ
ncbi:MAG: peptidoglycan-binding domain-containing protein [Terriglobia bacterium]